jgi:hypothetical protein
MNERDFVYWLNGFLELSGSPVMDAEQLAVVREHLALVLRKKTVSSVAVRPAVQAVTTSTAPSFFGGVNCGVCGRLCSSEGGTCRLCMLGVSIGDTRSHSSMAVCNIPGSHPDDSSGSLGPLCASNHEAGEAAPASPDVLDVPLHVTC